MQEFDGVPVRVVDQLPTVRWDVIWGPPIPRSFLGRWRLKAQVYGARARDAWLVLRGKAFIDDCDCC